MGARDLQPTQSSRSAGSTSTFVTSCPAGGLDPPGLPPVAKVLVRPTSSKRATKPSALDKHLRHVVLRRILQRSNRHKAHQHAATAQHNNKQRQRFANWSHALRNAILHRSDSPSSSRDRSRSPEGAVHAHAEDSSSSAQPVTAPAAAANPFPAKNAPAGQHQDDCAGCADIIHAWRPVAAAAQTRELQESLAMLQQQLQASLPTVLDPDILRPDNHSTAVHRRQHHSPKATASSAQHKANTSKVQGCVNADGGDAELDVDAFLDSLLLPAANTQPAAAGLAAAGGKASLQSPATAAAGLAAAGGKASLPSPATSAAAASKHTAPLSPGPQRPGSSSGGTKGRSVPAWAVSEQQQAAAEAAAAEQEERQLLQFADGLDWQELLQDMGDDELAAAFKELELADAEAAEGRPDADRRWQRCFVTAINAAAMRGIAASSTAAAGPGSQQGDQRSFLSSASAIRRAEAAEQRRQQLLQRLQRLTGTPNTAGTLSPLSAAAAAATGGGSLRAPSVCGGTGSRLAGSVCGDGCGIQTAAADVAASDSWESSTVVSSAPVEVGRLRSAIKHLEAREVLTENGELKGVHSTASVRSMLSKLEGA